MRKIASGHGNLHALSDVRKNIHEKKTFRYVVITKVKGASSRGVVGETFVFEVYGTDSVNELLRDGVVQPFSEILDTTAGKEVQKEEVAKEYVASLSQKAKSALIDEMLIEFLTK